MTAPAKERAREWKGTPPRRSISASTRCGSRRLLLAVTYAIIISEKVNRSIVAMVGAGLMVVVGVMTQEEALEGVDWNTIGLLTGMMILVSISRRSGMFQYLAIWSAQAARAHPAGILFLLQITTAVLSAFLDNVTTVLLVVPVTLAITKELKVPPYPFLFAEIFASNIGGTATLIGDPPNILIGSQVDLDFNAFVVNLAPVIVVIMVVQAVMIHLLWGRQLQRDRRGAGARDGHDPARGDHGPAAAEAVACRARRGDARLRAGAAAAPRAGDHRHARRRRADAARQLGAPQREGRRTTSTRRSATWSGSPSSSSSACSSSCTAWRSAACCALLGDQLVAATGGDLATTGFAILWASAVLSAIVDNIPFVATMIPLIKSMAPAFGGEDAILPLWWCLSLGACLGGNGTLIGASANLTRGRLCRAQRRAVPLRDLHALRFPDDAGLDSDRARSMCGGAISECWRSSATRRCRRLRISIPVGDSLRHRLIRRG